MITKTIKTSLLIIAITSFSFITAQERVAEQNIKAIKSFKKMDTNFDTNISLDEFKANRTNDEVLEKEFLKIDKDRNGSISIAEYTSDFESKAKTLKKRKVKMTEADFKKD